MKLQKNQFLLSTCAFALSTLTATTALAQISPSTIDPSRVERRFNEPRSTARATQEVAPTVPAVAAGANRIKGSFTLKSVQLTGNTVYDNAALESAWSDKIGQKISSAEAATIARTITNKYRTEGYVLSQAVIEGAKGGDLKLRVVEGFVNNVFIEGDEVETNRQLISKYAEKIKAARPLNTKDLERYLLLTDDLPGVTARGVIRPSPDTFGAADLVIQVKKKIFDGSLTTDNRGTRFIGRHQHQATLAENDLFGLYERTLIRGVTTSPTKELRFFDVQHEQQIGNEGTRLIIVGSWTRTEPGDILGPLDIKGDSDNYRISAVHPFIRSRKENLSGRVTLDARNSDLDVLGFNQSKDKIRSARVGGSFDYADSLDGVSLVDAEISHGFDAFGATNEGVGRTRFDGQQDYTKVTMDLSRIQNLPRGFSILAAATGQYAFGDGLLASEEIGLGGVGFGQAYDSSEITGDSGLAGKLEFRYGHEVGTSFFQNFQLYTYYDVGSVWNENVPAGTDDQQSLADVGLGIRSNFTQNFSGYAEVAFPLTRDVSSEGDDGARFFFSLTGRF